MSQERSRIVLAFTTAATILFAVIALFLLAALVCVNAELDISKRTRDSALGYAESLEWENRDLRRRVDDLELTEENYTLELTSVDSSKAVYAGSYYITGYDICEECCGKVDGITASGVKAQVGQTIASNAFPFGTVLFIDGIGVRTVEDRGPSSMPDYFLDVLCEDHPACYALTGWHDVYILSEG